MIAQVSSSQSWSQLIPFDSHDGAPPQISPELVSRILAEMHIDPHSQEEVPYLPIILEKLWEEEVATRRDWSRPGDGAPTSVAITLRPETLARLGGVARILERHLWDVMAGLSDREQEIAARIFSYLAGPSGTKTIYRSPELAEYSRVPEAELVPVLQQLCNEDCQILRVVPHRAGYPGYAIYHPILAGRVYHWQEAYLDRQPQSAGKQEDGEPTAAQEGQFSRQRWQSQVARLGLAGFTILLPLMIGLGLFAWQQYSQALQFEAVVRASQAETTEQRTMMLAQSSGRLAAEALLQLPLDPDLSLLLAIAAVQAAPTSQAQDTLREVLLYQMPLEPAASTVLAGHTSSVGHAGFDPGGKRVVTASFDGSARVWETGTGRQIAILPGNRGRVLNAIFAPDGKSLIAVNQDGTAARWDLNTGQSITNLAGTVGYVWHAAFSRDGEWIVTAGGLPTEGGLPAAETQVTDQSIFAKQLGLDFNALANANSTLPPQNTLSTLKVREVDTSKAITELRNQYDTVWSAAISPDKRWLVTGSFSGLIQLWEVGTGKLSRELRGHTGGVTSIQFSPDGQWLVTAAVDDTARVWEMSTGRGLFTLAGHHASLGDAGFSPDGRYVLTASADGTARIWALSTGRTLAILTGHTGAVTSAAFSPDGKYIVTTGDDGTARIFACEICGASAAELLSLARAHVRRDWTEQERVRFLDK